jgi:hypothetical protein
MISGRISEQDYLAAQRLHRKRGRKKLVALLAGLSAAGALAMWLHLSPYDVFFFGAAGALLVDLWPGAYDWKHRKIYKQQASLKQTFSYLWDPDALHASSEGGNATRKWRDYWRFSEDEHLFLLYHTDVMFEIIPKAWFADPDEIQAFRKLASKVGT